MANCDTKIYTNIKELPQIFNVTSGDYLIVENPQGTNIIDYKDVIVPIEQTTFAGTISGYREDIDVLQTQVRALTSQIESLSGTTKSLYTIKNISSTTIMLALSDAYTYNRLTSKDAMQIWLTKLPWSVGTEITFRRVTGAGSIVVLPESGVTVNDNLAETVVNGSAFMIKYIGNNTWDFI